MVLVTTRSKRCIALLITALPVISGCSSFGIYSPTDKGAVDGSAVSVDIKGGPSMTGLKVSLDGTDITTSLLATSDSEYQSMPSGLAVGGTTGQHVLSAEADVYCWYCSNYTYHPTAQVSFCAGGATNINVLSRTASSKIDSKGWSNNANTTVDVVNNASPSTSQTQWDMQRLSGIGSPGAIKSVNNRCVCMASVDGRDDTPIALKACDANDQTQWWTALPVANFSQLQNQSHGIDIVCLKEGNGKLVQHACDANDPHQLWSFFDLTNGIFDGPF